MKDGSAPAIYIKKIPPIPIGSSVTIQFEATFIVPSTPDQLNVYLKINSEVGEYKTNTFNKRPIFIWPSGSDYISCTLGVLNVASGGIVKACKDAGMIVSSINYVLFVADVNKLIEKAKAREFDREYWYVTSKCIISIGSAAKITGANVLSILLGSLEAAIPCANILNIYIEINQAFHTALYEVGFEVLTVIVGSPANVCIIDDNGNICGIFEDGTIIDQIPGSYISQFDHFKIVSVPGDGSKDEIKIEGTDNGEANVTLFKPKEMSATGVMISYDKVPVSPTTKIRIDMNPTSNPTYAMKIDNDGDGTIDETKEPDSIENIIADFPTLCTSPDPPSTNFGTVPEDQTRTRDFFITNSGSGTLTWEITCDQPSWLNVNPASDSTTKEVDVVTVTIDTHDLTPGTHTGHITITSNGGRKIGTITVNVPPPALEPKLCTSPDPPSTDFGTVPEDQTRTRDFFITNCGSGTLTWTITCDQPSWLNVNPAMGSTTALDVVTVTIHTHDLTPGTHTGHITLTSNGGEKTGTITVNVPPPSLEPKLCTAPDPPTINFGTVAKDQTRTWDFFITNCGSGTLTWTITCDKPSWLKVNRASGSTTTLDVVTVTIDTHDLTPGTHTGHITLTSNGGEKTGTITVNVPSKPSTPNVGFKGIVLFPCTYGDFTGQGIEVTKILSDPNGKLANGKNVCTYWTENTLAQIDNVACGDEVEVYGTLIEDPDVADVWMIVRLETSTHYIVRLKQGPPQLWTSPTTLLHDFGTVDKDQTRTFDFYVRNCGSGTLTWSVSDDKKWISVYPTSGSTTTERDTVTVRIDTQGLSPGTHTGYITLTSNGGSKTGTITVVVPEPQNQPPENPTLTSDRSSPQLAGTTIKWTASATNPDGDTLYYQFRLKGPATGNSWQTKRDWSTARTWTWYTTASDVGESDVSVRIRDGHHAQASSYDLKKTVYDYKITADKKRPTATIDSITPNPATQGDDTVRFKGHGYDSDGYIVEYYWKSSKDGKLSSSKEFRKSASKLAVGTHTIYFKVKDNDGQWSDWATMTLKIEKKEDSEYVKFRGVVTGTGGNMGLQYWYVNVDEWISGSLSCNDIYVSWGSGLPHGSFDYDISKGDRVEVYGVPLWSECKVGLNGESYYYIKKV